jgi:hypothetical protein
MLTCASCVPPFDEKKSFYPFFAVKGAGFSSPACCHHLLSKIMDPPVLIHLLL